MIDGHNDLPWAMRGLCEYDMDTIDLSGHVSALQTDIPRLRAGGVTGQFWSVYVPSTLLGAAAVTATLEQVDFVHRMTERYPDELRLARTADDVDGAVRDGRIASLMGMEGGHSIDESLGVLRMMYDLGVRYMTLTHNDNLSWADSATDVPVLGGLSAFGEDVVREMNRLGMLVDLSHVSADVMRHVLRLTGSPVMFSHSSARSVCDVPRNVPDDVLEALPGNDGVCMVTFVADFVSPAVARWLEDARLTMAQQVGRSRRTGDVRRLLRDGSASTPPPKATIDDVVAHIEHVRDVAGVDHVGIGGDFDGAATMPVGLTDVSGYPRLFDALSSRGWTGPDLVRLRGGNVLRVLRGAEASAHR